MDINNITQPEDSVLEEDENSPLKNTNPELEDLIYETVKYVLNTEKEEDVHFTSVIYLTCKEILTNRDIRSTIDDLPGTVFVYYLKIFLRLTKGLSKDKINETIIFNAGALSIFDLFLLDYKDRVLRKMIPLTVTSCREIIIAKHSNDTKLGSKQAIEYISSITMITSTIKKYLKPVKLKSNLNYIRWVQGFLKQCMTCDDLTLIFTLHEVDKQFPYSPNKVLKQIGNNKSTIDPEIYE
jgi:hypothetical protein